MKHYLIPTLCFYLFVPAICFATSPSESANEVANIGVTQTRIVDTSPHPILPPLFQRSPELLRAECAKCHSTEGFVKLNVQNLGVESLDPATPPQAITCSACHDFGGSTNPSRLRVYGDVVLESGHVYDDGGKAGLCASCHQSRVTWDLQEFIDTNPAGPHFSSQADVLMGINAWDFGQGIRSGESVHKFAIQDSCVACHMADVPAHGAHPDGPIVGGHSFKILNRMGTDAPADDVTNFQNACMSCHFTIQSTDRVLSTGRDYDGDGEIEGVQSEVRGLLRRIGDGLRQRYPAIQIGEDEVLIFDRSLYAQLSFVEKAAVYNHRLIQRDGSFGIHNASFAVEVLQKTYFALQGHSLKVVAPNAYMVGDTNIHYWSSY